MSWQRTITLKALGATIVLAGALACSEQPAPESAPGAKAPKAGKASALANESGGEAKVVKVAMTAAFVSESGVAIYEEIVDYMSEKLGSECQFITGFSYSAVDAMLDEGAADVGFVCGLPYVLKHDKETPAVELIAAPVMKAERYGGKPKYFSDVIVRKDSPFASFEDLRGAKYVYNDEISNSGYNLPRFHMVELGETKGFFGEVVRSGSHEESIRMVAAGEADASSVDSLVLDYDLANNSEHASKVKVVESIGPAGIPPVVVSAKVPAELREKIRAILVGMKDDPEGRRILDKALVKEFVAVEDSNYDDIREMKRAAEEAGFLELR